MMMSPLPNGRSRRLRLWEIALFVWTWQAADLALATGVGVLIQLTCGAPHGLVALLVALAIEPLDRLRRKSWAQMKAVRGFS